MKLKICGMTQYANILNCAKLNPDYLGFIFYDKSPRYFNGVIPKLPKTIKKTGVFVNPDKNYILEKVNTHGLEAVQLHGEESPELCSILMKKNIEVIKSFSINNSFTFDCIKAYKQTCSFFLFDTKGEHYGGNGHTFDWAILSDYPFEIPFFLSGGIDSSHMESIRNLSERIPMLYAMDINSRFEIEPGLKNIDLIKQFIRG